MTIANASTILIFGTPIYAFIIHKCIDSYDFEVIVGCLDIVPFILWCFLWFSPLAVKDFGELLAFALAFCVTGVVGFFGLIMVLHSIDSKNNEKRMEADRRYLDSLSPRERARETESRRQIARDVMAQIKHEQQLERDLEIIDRHFKRR